MAVRSTEAVAMAPSQGGKPMKLGLCVVGCGDFARTFSKAMQHLQDDIALFFASRDLELHLRLYLLRHD